MPLESRHDADGEAVTYRSYRWVICDECYGEGKSSAHLGSFTMEEFYDAFDDEDSREAYFAGYYDRTCLHCSGSGKLKSYDDEDEEF